MPGKTRTGARTFLTTIQKACRLSHTPGFSQGLIDILGDTSAGVIITAWGPLCASVELIIALDDWFNKVDATEPSEPEGEDVELG